MLVQDFWRPQHRLVKQHRLSTTGWRPKNGGADLESGQQQT